MSYETSLNDDSRVQAGYDISNIDLRVMIIEAY